MITKLLKSLFVPFKLMCGGGEGGGGGGDSGGGYGAMDGGAFGGNFEGSAQTSGGGDGGGGYGAMDGGAFGGNFEGTDQTSGSGGGGGGSEYGDMDGGAFGGNFEGADQTRGGDDGASGMDTDKALLDFDIAREQDRYAGILSGVSKLGGIPGAVLNGLFGQKAANYLGEQSARSGAMFGNRSSSGEGGLFEGRANDGNEPHEYAQPFGGTTPGQTTALPSQAPADSGARRYVWDSALGQYTLANLGAQANPMSYTQGQVFKMAAGGSAPATASGLGAAGQARFMRGGGTGLSDSIPVTMDDGGEGRLADGEFVFPADVVSGLGGGSSEAGSRALYEMIDRIRQQAHGSREQVKPVDHRAVMPV